jgi:hypothetical protein
VRSHWVKRWHGKQQVKAKHDTQYCAGKGARNVPRGLPERCPREPQNFSDGEDVVSAAKAGHAAAERALKPGATFRPCKTEWKLRARRSWP